MKLRRLYSNKPDVFETIEFRDGLNVVLGEVHRPKVRERDTHNLGKSLLAQVLDFALLKKKSTRFFLFRHKPFSGFVFFLEIESHDGRFITVRRSVEDGSKAAFAYRDVPGVDLTLASENEWQHWGVSFETARDMLDSALAIEVIKPWSYRNAVGYTLRGQKDYDDPFRLSKHAGQHSSWKPFLARMLGLNDELVTRGYDLEAKLDAFRNKEKELVAGAQGISNPDQLRGLLEIAERDVNALNSELQSFNLAPSEQRITRDLIDDIDNAIALLNEERYSLQSDESRIEQALQHRLSVDIPSLEKLFQEANVYFAEQVRKDYSALEKFNQALVDERDTYLKEELVQIRSRLHTAQADLDSYNLRRSAALSAISDAEALEGFRRLNGQLAKRIADLELLRLKHAIVEQLQDIRREIAQSEAEKASVHTALEADVNVTEGIYREIRRFFDDVVFRVIGRHGNIFTEVNKEGHPEFRADIVDSTGASTSASEGFSYGRLLCIAFDMAVIRAYSKMSFPHFVYHDGFLETLDDRKKLNLIEVAREYAREGVQHIVTVIESELPVDATNTRFKFDEDEIVVRLSDIDDTGRLFKMPGW